jgi:hypothetical protein
MPGHESAHEAHRRGFCARRRLGRISPRALTGVLVLSLGIALAACGAERRETPRLDEPGGEGIGGSAGAGMSQAGAGNGVASDGGGASSSPCKTKTVIRPDYLPTAADVQFEALSAMPSGEQILFSDLNDFPNSIQSIRPDGSGHVEIFRVHRPLSVGASRDGKKIAVAASDAQQEEHFGAGVNEAIIGNTFVYDVPTRTLSSFGAGDVFDSCHVFSPDGKTLYVCRTRHEGSMAYSGEGPSLVAIDLETAIQTVLPVPAPAKGVRPLPLPDGKAVLFTQWVPCSSSSLRKLDLASGESELVRDDAWGIDLSEDGKTLLLQTKDGLTLSDLHGTGDGSFFGQPHDGMPELSPDGSRMVYTGFDWGRYCGYVAVTDFPPVFDGGTRIRDCAHPQQISTFATWVTAP